MTREEVIECVNEVLNSDYRYDETLGYELTSYDFDWLHDTIFFINKLSKISDVIYGEWLMKQDYSEISLLNKIRNILEEQKED